MRAGYGILAACAAIALTLAGTPARAAGGAFAIDDAGVDDPGACKVEAFASAANNLPSDRVGVVSPACVVGLLNHRADLSAAIARSRSGGDYASSLTIKAKTPIPGLDFSKNDRFGIAVAAGYTFDLTHSGQDTAFAVVAATVRATPDLLFQF